MFNNHISIAGSESRPSAEMLIDGVDNSPEVSAQMAYIERLYADQKAEGSSPLRPSVDVEANQYQTEAVNEALSTIDARRLSESEIIAQASPEYQLQATAHATKLIDYYISEHINIENGFSDSIRPQSYGMRSDNARAA